MRRIFSKTKIKTFQTFFFAVVFLILPNQTLAVSSDYQRCEPGNDCVLGEYVFDNSYAPVSQQACVITVKNPSGQTVVDNEDMNFASDGWHSYVFSSSGPEGLYRGLMCCTIGSDSACLDKSFILGTSFESVENIESQTEHIRAATFDFSGLADSGSTNAALFDAELFQPDDYWNGYELVIISGANAGQMRTVSDFDSASHILSLSSPLPQSLSAGDKYVLRRDEKLIGRIWNYTNRTLTSLADVAVDIWSYSGRTLDSFGTLAADIWSDATAPNRTLTSENLSNGETLATESYDEDLKDEIVVEINALETDVSAVGADVAALSGDISSLQADVTGVAGDVSAMGTDLASVESNTNSILVDTQSIESDIADLSLKVDNLSSGGGDSGWGSYSAEEIVGQLEELSDDIEKLATAESVSGLDKIKENVSDNLDETKAVQNKLIQYKALLETNRMLLENKPVVKTYYEWGSVVLKMVIANPSSLKQRVDFKSYLPKEVIPEYIISKSDGVSVEYDAEKEKWCAVAQVELEGGASAVKLVEVKDVWLISQEELDSLKRQSEELSSPIEKTAYYAQGATLKNDVLSRLEKISRTQSEVSVTPEEHIRKFRENQDELNATKRNLENLRTLATEAGNKGLLQGSVLGVSATMTWAIILVVVVGVGVLLAFLMIALKNTHALTENGNAVNYEVFSSDEKKSSDGSGKNFLDKYQNSLNASLHENHYLVSKKHLVFIFLAIFLLGALVLVGGIFLTGRDSSRVVFENEKEKERSEKESETKIEEKEIPEAEENISTAVEQEPLASRVKIGETETGWLNFRSNPTLEGEIISRLNSGDIVEYSEEKEGWLKVKTKDGKTGWINGEYAEILNQ